MTATLTPPAPKTAQNEVRKLAAKHRNLTPDIVLRAAKPKSSPLHDLFCWDDTIAAHQYRLIQAAHFIRSIKVTYEVSKNRSVRIRAFHNVKSEPDDEGGTTGFYVGIETALSVESYRDQLIAQCKRDISTFRSKYAALAEVAKIISEMDRFAA